MPRSLVALGSNVGDRRATIAKAVELLEARPEISSLCTSPPRETLAIGGPAGQGPFLNAAVAFDTSLSPEQLHDVLHGVERALGRQRSERWAARTIDLDLLLYSDEVIDTPKLTVPHPRLAFRRFVLEPAADVAPQMVHPAIRWNIARLLAHLNTAAPYVAILGLSGGGKTALAHRLVAEFGSRFLGDPAAAGPEHERPIELLEHRARLLDRRTWPAGEQLAVSDFYFDQILAYAQTALSDQEKETLREAWLSASAEVVLPKLLVVLDTPRSGAPAARAGSPPRLGGQEVVSPERLAEEFARLAARPNLGPVLYAGHQAELQFEEASAAIRAMQ